LCNVYETTSFIESVSLIVGVFATSSS